MTAKKVSEDDVIKVVYNVESRDMISKLADIAFANVSKGEIEKTLETFFTRFRQQQFKRSCIRCV